MEFHRFFFCAWTSFISPCSVDDVLSLLCIFFTDEVCSDKKKMLEQSFIA